MRKHAVKELEGTPPAGVQDAGILVVYRLGHARARFFPLGSTEVACKKQTLLIRREAEHEPPIGSLRCEECGEALALDASFRAIGEVARGVLRYRVLVELGGKEQPAGPWLYLPVGELR